MRTLAAFVALQNCNFTPVFCQLTFISLESVASEISKSQFYKSFWRSTFILCERGAAEVSKSQFCHWFWRPTFILREEVAFDLPKCNFTPVFRHFPLTLPNRNFKQVFAVSFSFRSKRSILGFKLLSSHQFLTFDHCFAREGDDRPQKSRILPHVRASDMRNLCIGSRFHGHGRAALATQREDSEELDK